MGCNCGAVKRTANSSVKQVTKRQYSVNRLRKNGNGNGNSGMSRILRRVISH